MRLVVVTLLLAGSAHALDKGDVCTLKSPLVATINRPEGKVETTLDPGTDVEVVVVGDEGRARINTGDAKASVATSDLEAACAGTLQMCKLTADLLMFEKNRSDSRSWKLKKGAPVSVLRQGKVWAHLRVDDLEGFSKADELKKTCALEKGGSTVSSGADPGPTEEVDRGEGPGVLLLPFLLENNAPAGTADALAEVFFDRLAFYRPDAARLPNDGDRSASTWKKQVQESAARAKAAGLAYLVLGKLAVEPDTTKPGKTVLVVSLAMIDATTGQTLKGVRARPTTALDDPWASNLLSVLLPLIRTAPGSRIPEPPKGGFEVKGTTNPQPTQETTTTTANSFPAAAPWFANPWGYVALGSAVISGVGAGVVGSLAAADNEAANAAAPVDDARSELRASALTKAVVSDSLTVVAGVATAATVIVFATRAGFPE